MKIIVQILITLDILISFSFTVIAFYTDGKGIPYLYNGGYFYIVSSLILVGLIFLFKRYNISIWMNIVINILIVIYLLSALVFALISLYDMPLGYLNSLASTMFIISIMIIVTGIILFNKKPKNLFYTVLWMLFAIFILYVGGVHSLIQIYNSPDSIPHILYGNIIYFSTTLSFFILIVFIFFKINKIVSYGVILLSLIFLWIGIKILYSLLDCVNSNEIFISYIFLIISICILLFGIFINLRPIVLSSRRVPRRRNN